MKTASGVQGEEVPVNHVQAGLAHDQAQQVAPLDRLGPGPDLAERPHRLHRRLQILQLLIGGQVG